VFDDFCFFRLSMLIATHQFDMHAGTTGTENVAPEHNVAPGNISLKMKLMSGFCRSIAAANSFPATLQCIFGCMYGMLV